MLNFDINKKQFTETLDLIKQWVISCVSKYIKKGEKLMVSFLLTWLLPSLAKYCSCHLESAFALLWTWNIFENNKQKFRTIEE